MKKLLWVVVFLCLSPLLVSTAMAGRTDRMCYDFDSRTARVKERIAWFEKMLYDDLAGLQQDRARTQGNPRLALADEKLSLAIRLCNDALNQVQILRDRVPREIDCGERHRAVRHQIDAEVMALNDVEGQALEPQHYDQSVPDPEVRGRLHHPKRGGRFPILAPAADGKLRDQGAGPVPGPNQSIPPGSMAGFGLY